MRIVTACCLAFFSAAACAAPVTPPDSAKAPVFPDHGFHAEALKYAQTLMVLIEKIEMNYIRPVDRVDLFEAALVGLYETARETPPAGLRADLRQAVQGDLLGLVVRIRESLGDLEGLRGQKALFVSLQALPRALDPYCGLTTRHEFQRLDVTEGTINTGMEFVGVPLAPDWQQPNPRGGRLPDHVANGLPAVTGPLRVFSVHPGSPSQRAGILPGDLIIRLDGHPPGTQGFLAAMQRLRPAPLGTPIERTPLSLSVVRSGVAGPIAKNLTRGDYRIETVFGARRKFDGGWDYLLDPAEKIGYIRLGAIRRGVQRQVDEETIGSDSEFRIALRSLRASGVRGLVFDLRWCPGGYLRPAASIARLLLGKTVTAEMPIAWQRDRNGDRLAVEYETLDEPHTDFPVVVLINGDTSGGGELVAAALKDHGRAAIAGQRTLGKASIQTEITVQVDRDLPAITYKVTTGTFLRPSGKSLLRFSDSRPTDDWGVRPDPGRELPLTNDAGRRLKESWMLQTLRRPDDIEALPLDDPENDPQRVAAVQMLREMIRIPG